MNGLNDVIETYKYGTTISRDGFHFSFVCGPTNIYDGIIIRNPIESECWTPKYGFSQKSLQEHIEIINKYKLEKAIIIAENIEFITQCPTLKYLRIIPADTAPDNFDFSPLYRMNGLKYLYCNTQYGGSTEPCSSTIDYEMIDGLTEIYVLGQGHLNYNKAKDLQRLKVRNDKTFKNLKYLTACAYLKEIDMVQCHLNSLNGIGTFKDLQDLSIYGDRSLSDISDLRYVAKSLRSLSIENCSKISDFSCLDELINLEHLYLFGNNGLKNLGFLDKMPKLKTFSFSMPVEDGDLSHCLKIPYVNCHKNRKHYNFKDKDLPKKLPDEPFVLK